MRATRSIVCLCLSLLAGAAMAADSLKVRLAGGCALPGEAYSVAVSGAYAYVAAGDSGLRVVSVVDPRNPVPVGAIATPGRAYGVAVDGTYAYVADDTAGLRVISVADPAHPVEIGSCRTPGSARAAAMSGSYVCVADDTSGLRVISVDDPAHPVEVGYCLAPNQARDVVVGGSYAYIASGSGGLVVVSLADPANPVRAGGYYMMETPVLGVAASGDYVYITTGREGLHVILVTDPAHTVDVGHVGAYNLAWGVAVSGGYAYVAADEDGMQVISVTDPEHPSSVGHYDMPGWANGVTEVGGYAYVAYGREGLQILRFYEALGDIDVDDDSLSVVADTMRVRARSDGPFAAYALGEFVLANTSPTYNPDPEDGPSLSPVSSLSYACLLNGPGGTLDSILVDLLPQSLDQGRSEVCTLALFVPPDLPNGEYAGLVTITGRDTVGLQMSETFHALFKKLGDLDIVDSQDVVRDTLRARRRLVTPWLPSEYAAGEFVLANTSESHNPDTADGPSQSPVDSLYFTGSLVGPGGTLDSILISNLPGSLAQGQVVTCTLAVHVPPGLEGGDYTGVITVAGLDTGGAPVCVTLHALVRNTAVGDLDVDNDSLGVVRDTMNLHRQPAGPVYSPYAKAEFMLVNTYKYYNPDREDGPSSSPLYVTGYSAYLSSPQDTVDSIYVLNLPESLAVGQAVECTLALVVPVGTSLDDYSGLVAIDAYDTVGYRVRDSFFLTVRGPEPRQNLDSLRVAPIPFKPNQNPEHDAIHFQGLSAGARVMVYDASGQTVWSATENGDGHLAWKAEVASGIYVYLVVSADGKASKVGKLSVIR